MSDQFRESPWGRLIWTGNLAFHMLTQPRFPFRSKAAIERAQRRRLRAIVRHAYGSVPYYRETMKRLGLRPEDIRTADDLARLPQIERADLQRDPLYFVSQAIPLDRCRQLQTGGSSGEPVTIFFPPPGLRASAPGERARAVHHRLVGRRWGLRVLVVFTPMRSAAIAQAGASRIAAPAWMRRQTRELSLLDPPAKTLDVMNEFRPHVVQSYGSYLEALFLHAREEGASFHRPGIVTYSGDALSASGRRLISETFGIPVLAYYSAVEASPLGFECESHRGFHLNVDLHPVRIVDDAGEELPDGEAGAVVVSNLTNRATVLLNYRIGDVAAKLPGGCSCGRSLPMISFIEGRVDEWVATPSGEPMHPHMIRTLISDEEQVWRYQVAQRSLSHFEIVLVTAPACDRPRLKERLARKFAERLGAGTTIEVRFTPELPRSRGGKVRTVIGLPDARAAQAPANAR